MRSFIPSGLLTLVALLGLSNSSVAQAGQPPPAESLSLRAAIDEALRHSPQLLTSEDAVFSADVQRKVAQSRYRPAITPTLNTGSAPAGLAQQDVGLNVSQLLPSGAQVQVSASSLRYGSGPSAFSDAGYTIGVSQPLLRGFGASGRTELKTAERAAQGAERNAADARAQLVVSVAQAYCAVVREERLADIGERARQRAIELAEMSEARARIGLSTQLDVLRAGLLQSQAQAAALRGRDAFEAALEDLNVVIGRAPESPLTVEGDLAADLRDLEQATGRSADATLTVNTGSTRSVLGDRLDIQSARARLTDARWSASIAQWNLLPQMNLDVSYSRFGLGASPADSFTQLFNGWHVGLSTTYSLDRRADSAAAVLAQVGVRGAERAVGEAEQRATTEVRRASRTLSSTAAALALQQNALDLAERERGLATLRYERGLADNLEVIDADNNVFQAEAAVLGAQIDRTIAFITLQRASGTLNPDRFLQ